MHFRNIVLSLSIIGLNCLAGPPFVTDDPEPVDQGKWEINNALTTIKSQNIQSGSFPSVDINYGLVNDVQIHFQPAVSYSSTNAIRHYYWDDPEIGLKYRYINSNIDDLHFMISLYPIAKICSSYANTCGRTIYDQFYLPIWTQIDYGLWTIYGGGGIKKNNFDQNSINSHFEGFTILRQTLSDLQIGIELYRDSAQTISSLPTTGFNLGGKFDFNEKYHFLFSAGRAIDNEYYTNQKAAYLALQVAN